MELSNEEIRRRLELVAVVKTPGEQFEDAILGFTEKFVLVKSSKPRTRVREIRYGQIRRYRGTSHSCVRLALACVVGVPGAWDDLQRKRA